MRHEGWVWMRILICWENWNGSLLALDTPNIHWNYFNYSFDLKEQLNKENFVSLSTDLTLVDSPNDITKHANKFSILVSRHFDQICHVIHIWIIFITIFILCLFPITFNPVKLYTWNKSKSNLLFTFCDLPINGILNLQQGSKTPDDAPPCLYCWPHK